MTDDSIDLEQAIRDHKERPSMEAELTALRSANERYRAEGELFRRNSLEVVEGLRTRVKELEAALREIADGEGMRRRLHWDEICLEQIRIARAALKMEGGGDGLV